MKLFKICLVNVLHQNKINLYLSQKLNNINNEIEKLQENIKNDESQGTDLNQRNKELGMQNTNMIKILGKLENHLKNIDVAFHKFHKVSNSLKLHSTT